MNGIAFVFLALTSLAMFVSPRRFAAVPLLLGTCYMTLGPQVQLGPFSFTFVRILIAVGVIRVLVRNERMANKINRLDLAILLVGSMGIVTSIFHANPIESLGFVYNIFGIYFLLRVWCRSIDDAMSLVRALAVVLVPVALEMLLESRTQRNVFSILGGVPALSDAREGRLRAQGPFAHSILAGTVGAVCFPLMVGLWSMRRATAIIGLVACLLMFITCASSGPVASVIAGIAALVMWKWRSRMRIVRWAMVLVYALLALVMKSPPYFLMARIDLAGGSGGWHRAELIRSALAHLNEWWLWGTDYTRHWMPTGVSWSPEHTDITNYYVYLGVIGGLPLMLAFIWVLTCAYSLVGTAVRQPNLSDRHRFMTWTFGAALVTHTASCISVSYFDQSFMFLYLNLAVIGSCCAGQVTAVQAARSDVEARGATLASRRLRRPRLRRSTAALAARSR